MAVLQKINNLSVHLRGLQIHRCLAVSTKKNLSPSSAAAAILPPKRPQTAFINYFNDNRLLIIKQNPGIVFADISRLAGKQWKLLPETQRQQYVDKWTEKKIVYKKTLDSFMTSLSKEDRLSLDKQQEDKKKKKLAVKHKLLLKELNKPKRGLISAFLCYSSSQIRPSNLTQQMFTKKLGENWRSLSDNLKMPHVNKALDNQRLYQKNLRIWEKEMILDGRPELVRSEFREKKSKKMSKK